MLTKEQAKRIEQAIGETQQMLARAQRYSPEFQDKSLIAFCERHIAKLVGMLERGEWVAA
jgi:hypothetical protein